ncbi:MAG: hypothetical protein U5N10_09630 [Gemmobacter sp.]|nr:hypothetical protein [Gemmobacter sp.]
MSSSLSPPISGLFDTARQRLQGLAAQPAVRRTAPAAGVLLAGLLAFGLWAALSQPAQMALHPGAGRCRQGAGDRGAGRGGGHRGRS